MRLTDPPTAAPRRNAPPAAAEPALIEVYRETVRPLHRFIALRSGGSRQLIEDILQEVYLRAIEVWHGGRPPRDPLPWLKTLARNLLINCYRRHRPRLVEPSLLSEVVNSEQSAATPRAVALIHWGLARLPDRHARLIEEFHLEGRSAREIATAKGISERAVEGRLHRARKALKKRLEPLVEPGGEES
ncbi:MAG: sigma-70 family RNA polymerase sigma factor [Phycisphaerales bacterium]|nr:MAG: sigma-70 family RNA polymerase sigma factor [Phycisphaerales bacterium]